MKKWMMPIGLIVVICILTASVAMPICLADQNRIEIEGRLPQSSQDIYKVGQLQKGDEIKVVITDIRGNGDLVLTLTRFPQIFRMEEFHNFAYRSFHCLSNLPVLGCTCIPAYICADTTRLILAGVETASMGGRHTFTYSGEEHIFTIPGDGIWHLDVFALRGSISHYKGYAEIIKVPAVLKE
jgi:hypothetical protein